MRMPELAASRHGMVTNCSLGASGPRKVSVFLFTDKCRQTNHVCLGRQSQPDPALQLSTQLWLRRLQRENVSEYRSVFGKFKAATDGGNIARLDCVTHYYHFIFGELWWFKFKFWVYVILVFQLSTFNSELTLWPRQRSWAWAAEDVQPADLGAIGGGGIRRPGAPI